MISCKLTQEFIPGATRSSLETHCRTFNEVSRVMIEGLDRMAYLNLQSARAGVAEVALATRQLTQVDSVGSWVSMASAGVHPNVEQAISYARHAAGIFATVQANLARIAQSQLGEFNGFTQNLLEDIAQNVPDGPGNPWGFVRMAFQNASSGYEQLWKAARQAGGVLEGQLEWAEPAPFQSAWQVRIADAAAADAAAAGATLSTAASATAASADVLKVEAN